MKYSILILLLGISFGAAHAAEVKETKEKIQKDLQQGYESLKTQIRDLQQKAKTTSGSAKKDMDGQIDNLKKDQAELHNKIEKMKTSSGRAWDDLKAGANSAFENLKKSVHQAQDRCKEETK